jgi:hypothetical protein
MIDNQNGGKLYIPVSPSSHPSLSALDPNLDNVDHMDLEDTKHKIYIYDLDKELEGCESDSEERPIFIPDIEKHLNNLPKVVLLSDAAREVAKNMQMVLYNVPTSLTVPEDKDSVRKAIIESRKRMRDKQALGVPAKRTSGVNGTHADAVHRDNVRNREPNTLQVPTMAPEYLVSKATVNGYTTDDYNVDVMDMD